MGKHEGPYREEKRRFEFSKLIVVLAILMWLAVNIFGMVMMAVTGNLSPMVYVIGSVDAVMAIVCTTYSVKARSENIIKLKKLYGIDASDLMKEMPTSYNKYSNYSSYMQNIYDNDCYYDDTTEYEDASVV